VNETWWDEMAFETIPLDRITVEAREIHFGRTLLTVIAALLYGIGWTLAKTFTVLWFTAAWIATAVKVGWQEGRKTATPQTR
jgi:hypothetical protein